MLGHPTGRLLLERDACKVSRNAVIEACAAAGTWIELYRSPNRLDPGWHPSAHARKLGVRCVNNSEVHRLRHLGYLRLGAGFARKAELRPEDAVKTLTLPRLQKALYSSRGRAEGMVGDARSQDRVVMCLRGQQWKNDMSALTCLLLTWAKLQHFAREVMRVAVE